MTVAELRKLLGECPEDAVVFFQDVENGETEVRNSLQRKIYLWNPKMTLCRPPQPFWDVMPVPERDASRWEVKKEGIGIILS